MYYGCVRSSNQGKYFMVFVAIDHLVSYYLYVKYFSTCLVLHIHESHIQKQTLQHENPITGF